jgi:DNA-binding winged helix-turn-helix (wHTH) protein
MRIRFGDCLLDSATRQLVVKNRQVHLQPRAYQILVLLVESRPRVVSKDEIHEKLWPGTFISDGTLTSLIAEIRRAIGDDAREPRFVRTAHRFGYAFSGEAHEASEEATRLAGQSLSCWLVRGRRRFALAPGETIVGRDPGAAISIPDQSVSRRHAVVRVSDDGVTVEDLGSKNGTFVQGERVRATYPLADEDHVRFGSVELTLRIFPMPDSTRTAAGERNPGS